MLLQNHPALIFLVWAVWLSAEYLIFGPYSYVRIPDNANINLPARLAFAGAVRAHDLGYWVPAYASGADRLSELMGCQLDSLLYIVLPGWLAHGLFMFLQRFLAGYFCFRLMRDQLRLGLLPSLYAGLAYTLLSHEVYGGPSDNFTLYDGLVLPGLPLILWFLGRLDEQRVRSFVFALFAGMAFAFVGAFPIAGFAFPVIALWFTFVSPRRTVRFWGMLSIFCIGWLVGTSPYLWATGVNAINSHRSSGLQVSRLSNLLLAMMLLRDNAVALALGLCAFVATRGRERRVRSLCFILSVAFSFLIASPTLYRSIHGLLGFVSGFNFDRFYIFIPFFCVAGAALGLDSIGRTSIVVNRKTPRTTPVKAQTLLAVAAICVVASQSVAIKQETLWEMKSGSNFAAIFERPEVLNLRSTTLREPPFRVVTAGDHPSYLWAYGLETADGFLPLYSKHYQEYWGEVLAPVLAATPGLADVASGNVVQLFIPEATRSPLFGLPAGDRIDFDANYTLNLLSLANVRFVLSPVPLRTDKLTLLPSKFRDSQVPWTQAGRFSAFVGMLRGAPPGPPIYVYENPNVVSRFFLAGKVKVLPNAGTLEELRSSDVSVLSTTAFIEESDLPKDDLAGVGGNEGKVSLLRYEADRIELSTDASASKILVVTNSYSRFWKANVDGRPVAIFPVDHAFQGVLLTAGRHQVALQYAPPYGARF